MRAVTTTKEWEMESSTHHPEERTVTRIDPDIILQMRIEECLMHFPFCFLKNVMKMLFLLCYYLLLSIHILCMEMHNMNLGTENGNTYKDA